MSTRTSPLSTGPEARAWVRVHAGALRANYGKIREAVGSEVRIIPMVKADAYGVGVRGVVRALEPEGPWGWGVATVDEGIELRTIGVRTPVLVMCPLSHHVVEAALEHDLQLTASSLDALDAVVAAGRSKGVVPAVHVDVDTGMGRTGFDFAAAGEWLPRVMAASKSEIRWVGIQTHLHSADEDDGSENEQCARFQQVLDRIGADAPAGLLVHVLNSAGALRIPRHACSAVRPGIFLYGGSAGVRLPAPQPVVSVHARVVHVRDAAPGATLGYGATHTAQGRERWATLAIGYADGLPRALGNRGRALICGSRVRIVGRISMDMTVVDITGVPGVQVGDVATLLGSEGGESITVDDVAELAGTISYEVLTGLSPRLPRVWTGLDRGS